MNTDLNVIMEELQKGNRENEGLFYEGLMKEFNNWANVKGYKKGLGNDYDDVQQEALMKVAKNLHMYDKEKACVRTWFWLICGSVFSDYQKKEKKRSNDISMFAMIDGEEVNLIDLACSTDSVEKEFLDKETYEEAMEEINNLSQNYRKALSLKGDGYKANEIAKIMGCTSKEATNMLYRGKEKLKVTLTM